MPKDWEASGKALFGAASGPNIWISVTLRGAKAAREFKLLMLGICISKTKQKVPAWIVNLQFIYALKLLTAKDEKDKSQRSRQPGKQAAQIPPWRTYSSCILLLFKLPGLKTGFNKLLLMMLDSFKILTIQNPLCQETEPHSQQLLAFAGNRPSPGEGPSLRDSASPTRPHDWQSPRFKQAHRDTQTDKSVPWFQPGQG